MQGRKTTRLNCYLNPDRGSDRALLARLRADRAHGLASSEVMRRALTRYYERPALTPTTPPELATLAESVAALVESVTALQQQVRDLAAENAALKLSLVGATLGNREQRQEATGHAARVLAKSSARPNGNGNGGNGHGG